MVSDEKILPRKIKIKDIATKCNIPERTVH